jgi:hypothetical protein
VLGALAAAERWGQFRMYLERMEKDGVKLSAITYGWAMRGAERAQVIVVYVIGIECVGVCICGWVVGVGVEGFERAWSSGC